MDRGKINIFNYYDQHKGFYNDKSPTEALTHIRYTDFWEFPDDDDFPCFSAYQLLCGSCHHFALSLAKMFGYTPYIIEEINKKGFHVFCQIYKNKKWYYVDARGITTSFTEFMEITKIFVNDEYIIRPVNSNDITEWKNYCNYDNEAYKFSETVIYKYKECYTLE